MRATKFEFEQRFWIIGLLIGVAFSLRAFDPVNFGVGVMHWVAPSIDPDSAQGNLVLRMIFGAGALLIFLAALLRTWATAYLRTEVVHDARQHSEALVADGPYRHVRNPLYLANIPMAAGFGVMASRLGWLVMVVGMWLFVYRLILREEDGLSKSQGASFAAYLKAVPRLWPSLSARVPAGEGRPHWGQAILGEMVFYLFGAGVLAFAITLEMTAAYVVFGVGFAFYFIVVPILKRRAKPNAGK